MKKPKMERNYLLNYGQWYFIHHLSFRYKLTWIRNYRERYWQKRVEQTEPFWGVRSQRVQATNEKWGELQEKEALIFKIRNNFLVFSYVWCFSHFWHTYSVLSDNFSKNLWHFHLLTVMQNSFPISSSLNRRISH